MQKYYLYGWLWIIIEFLHKKWKWNEMKKKIEVRLLYCSLGVFRGFCLFIRKARRKQFLFERWHISLLWNRCHHSLFSVNTAVNIENIFLLDRFCGRKTLQLFCFVAFSSFFFVLWFRMSVGNKLRCLEIYRFVKRKDDFNIYNKNVSITEHEPLHSIIK